MTIALVVVATFFVLGIIAMIANRINRKRNQLNFGTGGYPSRPFTPSLPGDGFHPFVPKNDKSMENSEPTVLPHDTTPEIETKKQDMVMHRGQIMPCTIARNFSNGSAEVAVEDGKLIRKKSKYLSALFVPAN